MARTGIPIVFIHTGNPAYLQFTLQQARWASPECPVYLLGDAANRTLLDRGLVDGHFLLQDYMGATKAFDEAYVHLSAGTEAFEKFCFHRWFVLKALAQEQGWQKLWALDSDVLLYDSLEAEAHRLEDFEMAVCFAGVPAYTYFTLPALERFCAYTVGLYKDRMPELRHQFEHYLKTNPGITWGGITDMHAFWMHVQEPEVNAEDLSVPRDGAVFDQDFHQPQGFRMDSILQEKKMVWTNKTPYFITQDTGLVCRAKGLHCASGGKNRIFAYYTAPGLAGPLLLQRTRLSMGSLKRGLSPRRLMKRLLGRR